MDQEHRDCRRNFYKKHGRDTPTGRAKYEAGRWRSKTLEFKVQTAEDPSSSWIIYVNKNKGRKQICGAISSSNPEIFDTVQKCSNCNKYTTYSQLCRECTPPDQRLSHQPPSTGEFMKGLLSQSI